MADVVCDCYCFFFFCQSLFSTLSEEEGDMFKHLSDAFKGIKQIGVIGWGSQVLFFVWVCFVFFLRFP